MNITESWDEYLRQLEVAEAAVAAAHRKRGEAREHFERAGAGLRHHVINLDRGAPRPSPYYEDSPSTNPQHPVVRLPPHGIRYYEAPLLSHLFDAKIPSPPAEKEEFLPPLERQLSALSAVINGPQRDDATIARAEAWRGRLEYVRDAFLEAREALANTEVALAAAEGELEELHKGRPRTNPQALTQLAKRADQIGEDLEHGREKHAGAEAELQALKGRREELALGDLAARAALATGKDTEPAAKALADAEKTAAPLDAQIARQEALVEGLGRWLADAEAQHEVAQETYRAAAYEARLASMREAEQAVVTLLSESGPLAESVARLNSARSDLNAVAPAGHEFMTAAVKVQGPVLYGANALTAPIEFR